MMLVTKCLMFWLLIKLTTDRRSSTHQVSEVWWAEERELPAHSTGWNWTTPIKRREIINFWGRTRGNLCSFPEIQWSLTEVETWCRNQSGNRKYQMSHVSYQKDYFGVKNATWILHHPDGAEWMDLNQAVDLLLDELLRFGEGRGILISTFDTDACFAWVILCCLMWTFFSSVISKQHER